MKLAIEVTQHDIQTGIREDNAKCPIARACTRVLGRPAWVDPWSKTYSLVVNDQGPRVSLPPKVGVFIDAFDDKEEVSPFTFTLRIPAGFIHRARKR